MNMNVRVMQAKILILSAVILLSISFASIFVLLANAPASVCAFWRLFISSIILLLSLVATKRAKVLEALRNPRIVLLIMLSGFALAMHFLLWMESLFHVSVAISVTVVASYPLFNLLIDLIFFRERVSLRQVLGLVVGFIGLILFLNPQISEVRSVYGVLLALGGAVAASIYFAIGRFIRRIQGLMEYVIPVYSFAAIVLLVYNIAMGVELVRYSLRSYVFFLLLAVVPMLGGHTLMNYLLRYMKSSSVTAIALGEPVGASILAYLILGQSVSLKQAILMIVVLFSILVVLKEESPKV